MAHRLLGTAELASLPPLLPPRGRSAAWRVAGRRRGAAWRTAAPSPVLLPCYLQSAPGWRTALRAEELEQASHRRMAASAWRPAPLLLHPSPLAGAAPASPLAGGPCSLCRRAGHDPCLLRARRPPSSSPLARSLPSRHRRLPPVLPVPPSPARGRHGRRVRKGRGRERRRTGGAGSSSSAPPVPGGRSRGGARLVCPATPVVVPGLALSPYSGVAARSLRSGVGWRAASSSTSAAGRRRAAGKEEEEDDM